jgi:ubiquinone biosynthesis protein
MPSQHSAFSYLQRIWQVTAVVTVAAFTFVARRLRRRPGDGPELLRAALEGLSGSFVKFGQILSLQIDSLPRAYCDSLLRLLDRVPPFPREQVDRVFQQELGATPDRLFDRFDYEPVASASIGQVHRATLKDGVAVAVKVQRPGIRRDFERDVQLMRVMIWFIFAFRIRRMYFMRDPVRELGAWTQDELDYRREAAFCGLLGQNAVHTPTERVPRVYWDLTRQRVLTMEFLPGPSVADYLRMVEDKDEEKLQALRDSGFVPGVFSSNVISNFLSDAFRFGVFHADLHPANLLILPNNVVGYVDFGIVAVLTPEARRKQIELTLAYSSGDAEAIYNGFLNICMVDEKADVSGLRRRIEELTGLWYREPALAGRVRFRVTVTQTMMDLLSVCQNYGVLVDREMIKYIRSTILADGLVSRLAPEVDLAGILRRVVEDYLADDARKRVLSRGAALALLTDMTIWAEGGPAAFLKALNMLERGQIRVRGGIEPAPDVYAPIRTRLVSSTAVWILVMLVFGLGGGLPSWETSPVLTLALGSFLALLTLRILLLLRRLTIK